MQNKTYILFGFLFLYLINLALISLVLFVYMKVTRKNKQFEGKILSNASLLALLCIVLNSISLMFFSFHVIVFAVVSFLLFAAVNIGYMYKIRKFEKVDAITVSLVLAVALNPVWFNLLQGVFGG